MNVKEQKALVIEEIKQNFQNCQSAVIVDYRGLTVAEVTKLRAKFRKSGVEYKVYKNTMIKRAADELGYSGLDDVLNGTTAIAFGMSDPASPAKIVLDTIKDVKKMEVKAGVVEGRVIDAKGVSELSELPSKEELVAKMLGSMQAPISGLVGVLSGTIRKFAYVLQAVADQKSAQAEQGESA